MDKQREIKGAVFRLLSRREYCRNELEQRLLKKYDASDIEPVLDQLAQDGYQSDARFVDAFVRNRVAQCYGRKRICFDLQQKKLPNMLIEEVLGELNPSWFDLARDAWKRRFKEQPEGDYKVFGKQMRYLLQRGFSMDEARAAIDMASDFDEYHWRKPYVIAITEC